MEDTMAEKQKLIVDGYGIPTDIMVNLDVGLFVLHVVLIIYFWYQQVLILSVTLLVLLVVVFAFASCLAQSKLTVMSDKRKHDSPSAIIKSYILYPILYFAFYQALFRLLTFPFRKYPHFYILGEQKCFTTTLSHYLTDTELNKYFDKPFSLLKAGCVVNKDTCYFLGFMFGILNVDLYKMCFPLRNKYCNLTDILTGGTWGNNNNNNNTSNIIKDKLCFDASPSYLYIPYIRDLIYKLHLKTNSLDQVKFIIMLRDPVDRFRSQLNSGSKISAMLNANGIQANNGLPFLNQLAKLKDNNISQDEKDNILQYIIDFNLSSQFDCAFNSLKDCKSVKLSNIGMIKRSSFVTRGFYDQSIERYLEKFDKKQFFFIDTSKDLMPGNIQQTLMNMCQFLGILTDECKKIILDKHFNCQMHFNNGNNSMVLSDQIVDKLKKIYKPHNEKLSNLVGKQFDW